MSKLYFKESGTNHLLKNGSKTIAFIGRNNETYFFALGYPQKRNLKKQFVKTDLIETKRNLLILVKNSKK